jgi:hypothetical protein
MKKGVKSKTKTIGKKAARTDEAKSRRKNTSAGTRAAGRQRSGGNDPQPGSH